MFITHLAIGVLIYIILLNVKLLPASAIGFIAFIFGVTMPDIDHKGSYISKKIKPLSWIIRIFASHRGFTHSLIGAFAFSLGIMLILKVFNGPQVLAIWFFLGFIAHMIGDSLTPQGVKWLHPLSHRKLRFFVRTGSIAETLLLLLILLITIKIGWTLI